MINVWGCIECRYNLFACLLDPPTKYLLVVGESNINIENDEFFLCVITPTIVNHNHNANFNELLAVSPLHLTFSSFSSILLLGEIVGVYAKIRAQLILTCRLE